jgi:tetratricopeptide (TPR) repeat protein
VLALSTLLLFAATPAAARRSAKKKPAAEEVDKDEALQTAKAKFKEGEEAYKLGRFDDALAAYSAAYEAKALPAFLFNIGQCHRQLGNHERAIFFYKAFLREQPETPQREMVEAAIATAEEKYAAQLAEEEKKRAAEEALRLKQAEKERLQAEREAAREKKEAELAAAKAAEERSPLEEPWFWLTASGASVTVLALVGIGVATAALFAPPEVRVAPPSGTLGTINRAGE